MGEIRARMEILLQARPHRAPGCSLERQQTAAAAPAYILKDGASRVYMRLSEEGEFLWRQIDGARTIRDLCTAYAVRFQRRAPDEVLRALARVLEAAFITLDACDASVPVPSCRPAEPLARLASICTWYAEWPDIDSRVTALYRMLRPLYTRGAQSVLLALAIAGVLAFAGHCATGAK